MSIDNTATVGDAYRWCHRFANSHYENFPVASLLLPGRLRRPVAAIYAFARTADDVADEGQATDAERLAELDLMSAGLDAISNGQVPQPPLYRALADTIQKHELPLTLFEQLLSAFRQDVTRKRYDNFGELVEYCRRSANPVGRLLLHLENQATERNLAWSDAICSALQLINFLQDIHQDYVENSRIYIPLDEMQKFGVEESTIAERHNTPAMHRLLHYQINRAAQLLRAGSPLGIALPGRLGLEVRAIVLGGSRILEKLQASDSPFSRPRLDRSDRLSIIWGAVRKGFHRAR